MIITGIAHPPEWLHERNSLPSLELIFLAKNALRGYKATHLVSSLEPGWEQALAKAAIELEIAFTIAIPYPGRDMTWKPEVRRFYLELITKAADVFQFGEEASQESLQACHRWRVDHADTLLALWDYEFSGNTYNTMSYGLQQKKEVVNLWSDWQTLFGMRRQPVVSLPKRQTGGAQIFTSRSQPEAA